jgi:hypothetical protein
LRPRPEAVSGYGGLLDSDLGTLTVLLESLNFFFLIGNLLEFLVKLLEGLALFPNLQVLSALALSGKSSEADCLLVEPDSFLFAHLLLECCERADVRLNEYLLLSLLLFKDCLYLLNLGAELVKKLIALVYLLLFHPNKALVVFYLFAESLELLSHALKGFRCDVALGTHLQTLVA